MHQLQGQQQRAQGASLGPVRRTRTVRVRCLYKPPQQQQHRGGGGAAAAGGGGGAVGGGSGASGGAAAAGELRASALALGAERVLAAAPDTGSRVAGAGLAHAGGGAERLRVAVDVDEVLGRFVYALNGFCKAQYGMSYTVDDYWIYEFAKIWGCSQERSNHIVHEFFKSPHFNDGIPVIPEAFDTLQRLGRWCDLVVVTSRQHVIQDATLEWLDGHFPGTFQEVYFGNHFALEGTSRKKSDICASIGAHVLIDDNVGYALDCAHNGIRVLLYDWEGAYPWSKLPKGSEHPNIQIVRNWREVEQALVAMAVPAVSRAA